MRYQDEYNREPKNAEQLFWLQLALGVLMFAAFLPAVWAFISLGDEKNSPEYAATPLLTHAQMLDEKQKQEAGLAAPVSVDPVQYYRLMHEAMRIQPVALKYLDYHPEDRGLFMSLAMGLGFGGSFNFSGVQDRYNKRFGYSKMAEVSKDHPELMKLDVPVFSRLPTDYGNVGLLLWHEYEVSFLFGLFFFGIRVRRRGMNVGLEFFSIGFAAATWPYSLFTYPVTIDLAAQFKRAKRRLAYLMATLISFLTFGGLAKAAEQKNEGVDTSDHALVLDIVPESPKIVLSSGFDSENITGNGTIVHDGWISWEEANARFANGFSLDVRSPQALVGRTNSNEIDLTAQYSRKLGKWGTSFNLGLAYFDRKPLSSEDGDMLSPTLELDQSLEHGLTAFVKGQGLLLISGSGRRDGYVASAGIRSALLLAKGIELDQSVSVLNAGGPFGQSEGDSARYDGALALSVTDHLTLKFPVIKAFLPFVGAKGRVPTYSVGASVSYAF